MILLSFAFLALFHDNTQSLTVLHREDSGYRLSITVDSDRILQEVGVTDPDGTIWPKTAIDRLTPAILDYIEAHYWLRRHGEPWPIVQRSLESTEGFDPLTGTERIVELVIWHDLAAQEGDIAVELEHEMFRDSETFHANIFRIAIAGQESSFAMVPGVPLNVVLEDPTPLGSRRRIGRFFRLGVVAWRPMILAVLFLAAAVLDRRQQRLRTLVCFLAGALITYWCVALAVLEPAPTATRYAVGFSVLYLTAENGLAADRKLRWASAGLFGLVHGLNGANALLAHPQTQLDSGLCAFAFLAGWVVVVAALGMAISRWPDQPLSPQAHGKPRALLCNVTLAIAAAVLTLL